MKKETAMESPMEAVKPSLYLSDKDLPDIKSWKVGNKYKLELVVEQKSYSEDGQRCSARFDILKIKPDGDAEEKVEIKGQKEKVKALEAKAKNYAN